MKRKADNAQQQFLPILGELINRGDGTFSIRPTLPDDAGDTWISARMVKSALKGNIGLSTIYRYGDEGVIKCRKMTEHRVESACNRP